MPLVAGPLTAWTTHAMYKRFTNLNVPDLQQNSPAVECALMMFEQAPFYKDVVGINPITGQLNKVSIVRVTGSVPPAVSQAMKPEHIHDERLYEFDVYLRVQGVPADEGGQSNYLNIRALVKNYAHDFYDKFGIFHPYGVPQNNTDRNNTKKSPNSLAENLITPTMSKIKNAISSVLPSLISPLDAVENTALAPSSQIFDSNNPLPIFHIVHLDVSDPRTNIGYAIRFPSSPRDPWAIYQSQLFHEYMGRLREEDRNAVVSRLMANPRKLSGLDSKWWLCEIDELKQKIAEIETAIVAGGDTTNDKIEGQSVDFQSQLKSLTHIYRLRENSNTIYNPQYTTQVYSENKTPLDELRYIPVVDWRKAAISSVLDTVQSIYDFNIRKVVGDLFVPHHSFPIDIPPYAPGCSYFYQPNPSSVRFPMITSLQTLAANEQYVSHPGVSLQPLASSANQSPHLVMGRLSDYYLRLQNHFLTNISFRREQIIEKYKWLLPSDHPNAASQLDHKVTQYELEKLKTSMIEIVNEHNEKIKNDPQTANDESKLIQIPSFPQKMTPGFQLTHEQRQLYADLLDSELEQIPSWSITTLPERILAVQSGLNFDLQRMAKEQPNNEQLREDSTKNKKVSGIRTRAQEVELDLDPHQIIPLSSQLMHASNIVLDLEHRVSKFVAEVAVCYLGDDLTPEQAQLVSQLNQFELQQDRLKTLAKERAEEISKTANSQNSENTQNAQNSPLDPNEFSPTTLEPYSKMLQIAQVSDELQDNSVAHYWIKKAVAAAKHPWRTSAEQGEQRRQFTQITPNDPLPYDPKFAYDNDETLRLSSSITGVPYYTTSDVIEDNGTTLHSSLLSRLDGLLIPTHTINSPDMHLSLRPIMGQQESWEYGQGPKYLPLSTLPCAQWYPIFHSRPVEPVLHTLNDIRGSFGSVPNNISVDAIEIVSERDEKLSQKKQKVNFDENKKPGMNTTPSIPPVPTINKQNIGLELPEPSVLGPLGSSNKLKFATITEVIQYRHRQRHHMRNRTYYSDATLFRRSLMSKYQLQREQMGLAQIVGPDGGIDLTPRTSDTIAQQEYWKSLKNVFASLKQSDPEIFHSPEEFYHMFKDLKNEIGLILLEIQSSSSIEQPPTPKPSKNVPASFGSRLGKGNVVDIDNKNNIQTERGNHNDPKEDSRNSDEGLEITPEFFDDITRAISTLGSKLPPYPLNSTTILPIHEHLGVEQIDLNAAEIAIRKTAFLLCRNNLGNFLKPELTVEGNTDVISAWKIANKLINHHNSSTIHDVKSIFSSDTPSQLSYSNAGTIQQWFNIVPHMFKYTGMGIRSNFHNRNFLTREEQEEFANRQRKLVFAKFLPKPIHQEEQQLILSQLVDNPQMRNIFDPLCSHNLDPRLLHRFVLFTHDQFSICFDGTIWYKDLHPVGHIMNQNGRLFSGTPDQKLSASMGISDAVLESAGPDGLNPIEFNLKQAKTNPKSATSSASASSASASSSIRKLYIENDSREDEQLRIHGVVGSNSVGFLRSLPGGQAVYSVFPLVALYLANSFIPVSGIVRTASKLPQVYNRIGIAKPLYWNPYTFFFQKEIGIKPVNLANYSNVSQYTRILSVRMGKAKSPVTETYLKRLQGKKDGFFNHLPRESEFAYTQNNRSYLDFYIRFDKHHKQWVIDKAQLRIDNCPNKSVEFAFPSEVSKFEVCSLKPYSFEQVQHALYGKLRPTPGKTSISSMSESIEKAAQAHGLRGVKPIHKAPNQVTNVEIVETAQNVAKDETGSNGKSDKSIMGLFGMLIGAGNSDKFGVNGGRYDV
jgi:hypothetical protein